MNNKSIFFLCLAIIFGWNSMIAQTEKEASKKVVIVKKEIDKNGKEVIKKNVLEGKEAEEYIGNAVSIGENGEVIKIEEKEIEMNDGKKTEKKVRIMKFEGDDKELSPEIREQLKKEGIDIDKLLSEEGDSEVEIEKEVIIKKESENDTGVRVIKKKMSKNADNSLDIKNLDINIETKTQTLSVQLVTEAAPSVFRLIDTTGKVVYEEDLPKFNGKLDRKINYSQAAPGGLLLTMTQGKKVFSELLMQ